MAEGPILQSEGICSLLQSAHRRFRDELVDALRGSGLTVGQWTILEALTAANDRTQSALTSATGIEKSSMVNFVDGLEADGWVERRLDPDDRRARIVHLRSRGRKRLAALEPRLRSVEDRFLSALSRTERAQLLDLLRRLR